MSQERRRAREARQAARRAEVEAAARRRARLERRAELRKRLRRRHRYGQLSTRALAQLVAVFVAAQALAWAFIGGLGARFAVAVLTVAVLLVVVRTRRRPAR